MFEAFILSVLETLKGFGYFGILFALCFEFVPAEIVLPLAGFWVAEGDFHYALTVLAGSVGGTIGPITLYALGKYGGRPMVIKYGKYFLIQEKQIRAADRFFEKYGASVAFFCSLFSSGSYGCVRSVWSCSNEFLEIYIVYIFSDASDYSIVCVFGKKARRKLAKCRCIVCSIY